MLPAVMHRRWAREFLALAQEAPNLARKVKYLRLAVSNSVRAQTAEAEAAPAGTTGANARKPAGS
jgi:hypothetical protein